MLFVLEKWLKRLIVYLFINMSTTINTTLFCQISIEQLEDKQTEVAVYSKQIWIWHAFANKMVDL